MVPFNPVDRQEPVVNLPIDGVLDLHSFRPSDVKEVVCDYLSECQSAGILQVRVIHGKGIGNLRRTVHSLLLRHPQVLRFADCSPAYGGLGATLVELRKAP